jgi:ABC-type transport system involved in cytochrome c biogenesis permease component
MDTTKIILAVLWIAVMLTYLLGDVIRIFSGDVTLGEIEGQLKSSLSGAEAATGEQTK